MVAFSVITPHRQLDRRRTQKRGDLVDVLDAAYDLKGSDEQWMTGLVQSMIPLMSSGHGTYGFCYRWDNGGWQLSGLVQSGCPENFGPLCEKAITLATDQELASFYFGRPCTTMCQGVERMTPGKSRWAPASYLAEQTGLRDQLLVTAWEADSTGCLVAGFSRKQIRVAPRTGWTLARVARHIAAARRLRAVVKRSEHQMLNVDAVLSPNGQVLHAEASARARSIRDKLSAATLLREESRLRPRKVDSEQALWLWTALVDGKWSLVDTLDSDGKRLLLARRNIPDLHQPRALSREDRHLLSLAARGHSVALLAHELGLPVPRVSERLSRALSKLGLKSRTELVRYFGVGSAMTERTQ